MKNYWKLRLNLKLHSATAAIAVIGLTSLVSPTIAQTYVPGFAPFSATPTAGVWYESDVRPGGTASVVDLTGLGGNLESAQPLPIRAAKITTDGTGTAKAEIAVQNNFGVLNDILAGLKVGYSWHKATSGVVGANLNAVPALKLTFLNTTCDQTLGGDCFATLIYEPYENGFGNFPTPDQWERSDLDMNNGHWWTSGGFGIPNGFGGCDGYRDINNQCPTLAQWVALSSPDFGQATLVGVAVGVGSNNPGQIGYFDEVTIEGTLADAVYDFELAPTALETKQQVLADLQALLPTLTKPNSDKVKSAIEHLQKSLNPKFWAPDGNHLTKDGKPVFDEEKKAVHSLEEVVPRSLVIDAINSLVADDRALATTAIAESTKPAGDITKANNEIAKGDQDNTDGKYEEAIGHYKNAWDLAT